jgi:hypothetical protein
LKPGVRVLLASAGGDHQRTIDMPRAPQSQRLVLAVNPVERGATMEATKLDGASPLG